MPYDADAPVGPATENAVRDLRWWAPLPYPSKRRFRERPVVARAGRSMSLLPGMP